MKDLIEQLINQDKIEAFGDEMPVKYQLIVAALLVYAAKSDGRISEDELQLIMSSLAKEFGLSDNDSSEMIETGIYLEKSGKAAKELAARLKDVFITAQKTHLLSILTKAVKADGLVQVEERLFLGEVAEALGLNK